MVNSLHAHNRLICLLAFFDEHLLDSGGGVRLIDDIHALQEVVEQLHHVWSVLIWRLISEHVQELNARGLHKRQFVNIILLKLWEHELLDVLIQSGVWDHDLDCAVLVIVRGYTGGNQKVEKCGLLWPIGFSV